MQSVIDSLRTDGVSRIRIGIGRPPLGMDEIQYVLGRFTREEDAIIKQVRGRVADAVIALIRDGVDSAMNQFNTQPARLGGRDSGSPSDVSDRKT